MSVASPVALPQAPVTRRTKAARSRGLRLLFAVILLTSLSAVALSVVSFVKPIGHDDGSPATRPSRPCAATSGHSSSSRGSS
jgi:hypothetical protein